MGFKEALEFLGRGETPSDKAPELGLTPKNVTAEDLKPGTVEALESEPAHDSSGAGQEAIGGDGESEDKKLSPPDEEKGDTPEAELEAPQLTEESAEHPTEQPSDKKPATKLGKQHVEAEEGQAAPAQIVEVNAEAEAEELPKAMEDAADEAAPDSGSFLGIKAADEIEPGRATLAAATILPLSLLGNETWVRIVVLVCIAIAVYFFLRWYFRRGENTSPLEQEPQTVEGFMRDF